MSRIVVSIGGEVVVEPLSEWEETDRARRRSQAADFALEMLKQEIEDATQAALDDFARTRGYENILSACTYATSAVPQFASEGAYCVGLRDATWAALYMVLSEVEGGTRAIPSGFDEIAGELPTSTAAWP